MEISFDRALGIHEQALDVRSRRAEVLANNLANVDTPNFKARDIAFKSMLDRQVNAVDRMQAMQHLNVQATRAAHIAHLDSAIAQGDGGEDGDLLYRTPTQPSVDGNTVDENVEQAEYMKNALNWQASFQFLSAKFKGLKDAIRGD